MPESLTPALGIATNFRLTRHIDDSLGIPQFPRTHKRRAGKRVSRVRNVLIQAVKFSLRHFTLSTVMLFPLLCIQAEFLLGSRIPTSNSCIDKRRTSIHFGPLTCSAAVILLTLY